MGFGLCYGDISRGVVSYKFCLDEHHVKMYELVPLTPRLALLL
jgi:hypothetical protein